MLSSMENRINRFIHKQCKNRAYVAKDFEFQLHNHCMVFQGYNGLDLCICSRSLHLPLYFYNDQIDFLLGINFDAKLLNLYQNN